MTPDEKAELRNAAEAAIAGPWTQAGDTRRIVWTASNFVRVCVTSRDDDGDDAAFIAAANPATVLALLDENARLAAEVDGLRARLHQHEGHYDAQGLLK